MNDSSTRGQPSSGETSTSGVALGEQGAAVSRSFQDLRGRVKPGTTVSVIDTTGNEIRGEIVEIASSSLALLIDGNRRDLPESSVLRIARRGDPVWNGTAIGAAVGAGVGLAILGALCEGICRGPVETTAPFVLFTTGVWTGIGVLVDALIRGETLIFQASGAPSGSVSVSPIISKERKGVAVSLSF